MEATLERPAGEIVAEKPSESFEAAQERPDVACQAGRLACGTCINTGCPLWETWDPNLIASPPSEAAPVGNQDMPTQSVREQLFDDGVDIVRPVQSTPPEPKTEPQPVRTEPTQTATARTAAKEPTPVAKKPIVTEPEKLPAKPSPAKRPEHSTRVEAPAAIERQQQIAEHERVAEATTDKSTNDIETTSQTNVEPPIIKKSEQPATPEQSANIPNLPAAPAEASVAAGGDMPKPQPEPTAPKQSQPSTKAQPEQQPTENNDVVTAASESMQISAKQVEQTPQSTADRPTSEISPEPTASTVEPRPLSNNATTAQQKEAVIETPLVETLRDSAIEVASSSEMAEKPLGSYDASELLERPTTSESVVSPPLNELLDSIQAEADIPEEQRLDFGPAPSIDELIENPYIAQRIDVIQAQTIEPSTEIQPEPIVSSIFDEELSEDIPLVEAAQPTTETVEFLEKIADEDANAPHIDYLEPTVSEHAQLTEATGADELSASEQPLDEYVIEPAIESSAATSVYVIAEQEQVHGQEYKAETNADVDLPQLIDPKTFDFNAEEPQATTDEPVQPVVPADLDDFDPAKADVDEPTPDDQSLGLESIEIEQQEPSGAIARLEDMARRILGQIAYALAA